ncbi:MAG: thiosulfate dehydrogenase (quinone) large subunit [Micromonosporaceae bacterium]|nr:thiosulfate dehydrogenase (quinone) large subunit [Micromonosporaceae bacterium]
MVDIAKNHHTTQSVPSGAVPLVVHPDTARRSGAVDTAVRRATPVTGVNGRPTATAEITLGRRSGPAVRYLLAGVRLALGWIFLWAFLDKLFGLGHDTTSAKSWINGGSPTKGFLGSASAGPLRAFSHSIAGAGVVDVLFMAALLGIGVALMLGVGMRLAAGAGAVLTVLMWSVVLPPANNPFMDDHLIYAAVLIVLALLGAGNTLGWGRRWARLPLVQRASWLK